MPKKIEPDKYWYGWYGKGFDDGADGKRKRSRHKAYLKGYRDGSHYMTTRRKYGFNPREQKPDYYDVYYKGTFIGTLLLTPSRVKDHEKAGYRLRKSTVKHRRGAEGEQLPNRKRKANPKGLTLIYPHITRVEGTKGSDSAFPNQKFFHNFKRPYPSMYGTADRKTLIIK